jgi:hypothetical protein
VLFSHVPAACLLFAAFVLVATVASRRRQYVAGLLGGLAVLLEYQAALGVLVVASYVLVRRRPRGALRFCLGGLPAAAALAAYNTTAFDRPWRLSYDYIGGAFAAQQDTGFFGIGLPKAWSLVQTLAGPRGLLTVSPVLAAAGLGLVLLWRRGLRLEAATCLLVVALYLLLEAGYFLPYGGFSPGPRFLTCALPFLLLGLPPALQRHPRAVGLLLVVSVLLTTANALSWPAYAPDEVFAPALPTSVWSRAGLPLLTGTVVTVAATVVGLVVALAGLRRPAVGGPRPELADQPLRG